MAMKIVDTCINCAACEPECPNEAISRNESIDLFVIDVARCTECVGAHDVPQCVQVCPVDCIVPDPDHAESREQLQAKYEQLHVA